MADDPTPAVSCVCCGFVTLEARGDYDICPVCFWENDHVVDPHTPSGPNHMTPAEGRANFARFGACEQRFVQNVLPPTNRSRYERRPVVLRGLDDE